MTGKENGVKSYEPSGVTMWCFLAVCVSVPSNTYPAEGFPVPDVKVGKLIAQKWVDGDGDILGNETLATLYHEVDSPRRFATFEYKGKIYAYDIDNNRSGKFNYTLLDLDCDGTFETRILPGDHFYVPDCLK